MTANSPTADFASPLRTGVRPHWMTLRFFSGVSDRAALAALLAALALLYGLLQNPYWVPAGDSELYTAAARNLAIGHGYTFNAQPIAITPPGWSLIMAAIMKVTPYFLPLKLLVMTMMIASLAIGYRIVRRFVPPAHAVAIILLTAVLSHVYQATYWLISESSFCLVSAASLLIAMQIAEGRRQRWRIALLLALCAAAVTIRWAGVIGMLLVVAALLDGELKPKPTAPWIVSLAVVFVTLLSFIGLRHALRGTPEQNAASSDMVTGSGEDIGTLPTPDNAPPVTGAANQSAKAYHLFPTGSYADRLLNWGRWFSYLYWQPFRAAGASAAILAASTISGWIIIAVLAVVVLVSIPRRKWIWLATGAYTGVLALGWTNVNARYYVPIAFLITLGIFLATDELTAWAAHRTMLRRVLVAAFLLFVGSVTVCNGALYAVEMAIARSDHFYSRYEDGLNVSLIQACQYLNTLPEKPKNDDIAVSQRYTNLNRAKASPFGLRAAVLLTGREIQTPRYKDTALPPNSDKPKVRDLRKWLRSHGVKWYLYQPEISPWRVWHFRLGWYEKWQTGHTADKDTAGWQLYRAAPNGDDWIPVRLPNRFEPVTRVPGL